MFKFQNFVLTLIVPKLVYFFEKYFGIHSKMVVTNYEINSEKQSGQVFEYYGR